VIDELESHLRDEVERLTRGGLPLDQAWPQAVARLGGPEQLAAEFAKVPPAAAWLPGRLAVGALALLAVGLLVLLATSQNQRMGALLSSHVFTVVLGYLTAFAVAALAGWSLAVRAVRGADEAGSAGFRWIVTPLTLACFALTAVGVALGAVWASEHMGRAWGWDAKEVGGAAVVLWAGLAWVVARRGGRAGLAVGVVGGVVVLLAWFVPPLLDHGLPWLAVLALILVLLVHLAALALALLPGRP